MGLESDAVATPGFGTRLLVCYSISFLNCFEVLKVGVLEEVRHDPQETVLTQLEERLHMRVSKNRGLLNRPQHLIEGTPKKGPPFLGNLNVFTSLVEAPLKFKEPCLWLM